MRGAEFADPRSGFWVEVHLYVNISSFSSLISRTLLQLFT